MNFLSDGDNNSNDSITDSYLLELLLSYQLHKKHIVMNLRYLSEYESSVKNDLLDVVFYDGLKRNLSNLINYMTKIIIYTDNSYKEQQEIKQIKTNHIIMDSV